MLARALKESLSIYSTLGYTQRIARAHLSLAEIDERDGDLVMAAARAREAFELFHSVGYIAGVANAELVLGRVAIQAGDIQAGIPLLASAIRRLNEHDAWVGLADVLDACVVLAVDRDRPEFALRLACSTERMRTPPWYGTSHTSQGQLQQRLEAARRALGRTVVERIHVEARLAPLEEIVSDTLAFLEHARLTAEPTTPASRRSPVLSPRERHVVRLLAAGMTDRQIAEELFITRKTASHHVGHILAKLGVANRAEAAAVALRDGLV